jgi:predicted permease
VWNGFRRGGVGADGRLAPRWGSLYPAPVVTVALQILCILGLISGGALARRRGWLGEAGTTDLSRVLVSLVYPALIVVSVTHLSAGDLAANWLMPAMGLVVNFTGIGLGLILLRLIGRTPERTARSFLFQCLMNNSLFLPLPLVALRYGDRGVALLVFSAIAYDLVLWTVGVFVLAGGTTWRQRMRSLWSPSFVTLVVCILVVLIRDGLSLRLPEDGAFSRGLREGWRIVEYGLRLLGQGTIPISILVAGSRIAVLPLRSALQWRVWLVSAIRLVAVPLLVIPLALALPMEPVAKGVVCIVAAMPCAIISVVFGERYGGDTEFIAGALLMTHLWAVITVPVILAFVL